MENDRSTLSNKVTESTSEVREKLLNSTEELIYRRGISSTGMDLIVKTSGVSRKTIYRYFGTKEALVAEVLKRRDERWMLWFISEVEKEETTFDKLLSIFDVLTSWFVSEGFRGCAFINTAGETGDVNDPVRLVAKEHKEKIVKYIRSICQEHGVNDPDDLAEKFLILIDGAISVAHVVGDYTAAKKAREIAKGMLAI